MNTFDEIIQTKAYSDLTPAELEVIRELVSSEQEYNEMKGFYTEINQLSVSSREEVSPAVKSSLNAVFQSKHPGIHQNWSAPVSEPQEVKVIPLYNRNWFRVAALLVVSAGVATIWISAPESKQLMEKDSIGSTQMAQTAAPAKEESTAKVETKKKFPIEESDSRKYTASSTIVSPENQNFKSPANEDETRSDRETTSLDYELRASNSVVSFSNPPKADQMKEEITTDSFAKAGMDADLNPWSNMKKSAESGEISTNDLLSLIEPSF
ncbi:hypothetical protein [Fluviicola sp.]|uniref:hypothetical protein n=1 Tax=Fluviicola sp. TaxID=1917219 RepID=UPI00263277AF|nr:hypothetical protein [Fluviicola sp.]